MIDETQISAIATLQARWGGDAIVLIGAAGLGMFLDMRWRGTDDLDLTAICDVETVMDLAERLPGWRTGQRGDHSLVAPGGVRIDLIPASAKLLEVGEVRWPGGFRMSLLGMRLAIDHAVAVDLGAGRSVRVAPPEVITVLKMVAYLDRPQARQRDLIDVANILEERVAADDEDRYSSGVLDADLNYDEAGPYVVGGRVGAMLSPEEFDVVARFLGVALDPFDAGAICQRLVLAGPSSWRDSEDGVRRRLAAFARGVSDARVF